MKKEISALLLLLAACSTVETEPTIYPTSQTDGQVDSENQSAIVTTHIYRIGKNNDVYVLNDTFEIAGTLIPLRGLEFVSLIQLEVPRPYLNVSPVVNVQVFPDRYGRTAEEGFEFLPYVITESEQGIPTAVTREYGGVSIPLPSSEQGLLFFPFYANQDNYVIDIPISLANINYDTASIRIIPDRDGTQKFIEAGSELGIGQGIGILITPEVTNLDTLATVEYRNSEGAISSIQNIYFFGDDQRLDWQQ
jgi:hypothetical protein